MEYSWNLSKHHDSNINPPPAAPPHHHHHHTSPMNELSYPLLYSNYPLPLPHHEINGDMLMDPAYMPSSEVLIDRGDVDRYQGSVLDRDQPIMAAASLNELIFSPPGAGAEVIPEIHLTGSTSDARSKHGNLAYLAAPMCDSASQPLNMAMDHSYTVGTLMAMDHSRITGPSLRAMDHSCTAGSFIPSRAGIHRGDQATRNLGAYNHRHNQHHVYSEFETAANDDAPNPNPHYSCNIGSSPPPMPMIHRNEMNTLSDCSNSSSNNNNNNIASITGARNGNLIMEASDSNKDRSWGFDATYNEEDIIEVVRSNSAIDSGNHYDGAAAAVGHSERAKRKKSGEEEAAKAARKRAAAMAAAAGRARESGDPMRPAEAGGRRTPPPDDGVIRGARARRGHATDSHSVSERRRRERINKRMKLLQELIPNCENLGKAAILEEIINYVKSLQQQIEFLSMKLAATSPNNVIHKIESDESLIYFVEPRVTLGKTEQ